MKSRFYRLMTLFALVLVAALSACAPNAARSSSANDQPAQPVASATLAPTAPAPTTGNGVTTALSCDELIPPDEANSLMTGLSPALTQNAAQGKTDCTWEYTSKAGGQTATFLLQAGYGASAVDDWDAARKSELAGQPSDLNVVQVDGLGDENYTWIARPDNLRVVYVRRGSQTLIMHYHPTDILFMGTESGMIDMADRIFNRMNQ